MRGALKDSTWCAPQRGGVYGRDSLRSVARHVLTRLHDAPLSWSGEGIAINREAAGQGLHASATRRMTRSFCRRFQHTRAIRFAELLRFRGRESRASSSPGEPMRMPLGDERRFADRSGIAFLLTVIDATAERGLRVLAGDVFRAQDPARKRWSNRCRRRRCVVRVPCNIFAIDAGIRQRPAC